MKYDDFRIKLKSFLSTQQTIQTPKQSKEFDAVYSAPEVIITPLSSGKERIININEFWKIWRLAKDLPKHERLHPIHYQTDTMNASYILTLIGLILKDQEME